jgi:quinol monooxygenase YgiN
MIVQIVRASIKPEQRDRWLEVIARNATQTRTEEGCQGYQVAEDLEVPNNFLIVELWTNLDAVKNHFRAQFEELMAALGDVFAEPPEAFIHEVASTMTLQEVLAAAGMAR